MNSRRSAVEPLPEGMLIGPDDVAPQPLDVWRDALGHPWVAGHCTTCGTGNPCLLMAFFDAVRTTTLRRMEPVGVAEAAKLLELSKSQTWRVSRSHDLFPEPVAYLVTGPVWDAHEVREFAKIPRPVGRPRKEKEKEKET
jgi:hypothetical protein